MKDKQKSVSDTLDEMTTYFSRLYSEHDTSLSEYKAKLFEVNVRLDELLRTQNIYSLNMDYRRNVFSPISSKAAENEKEIEIEKEIKELKEKRDEYETGINTESIYLKSIDKRIKKLNSASVDLNMLVNDYHDNMSIIQDKNEEVQDKENELEELDNEIERLDKKIADLEKKNKGLSNEIDKLEKENEEYFDEIDRLETENKEYKEKLEKLQKETDLNNKRYFQRIKELEDKLYGGKK